MIQPILHLHVCADPAEPLHSVANYATDGAALPETS
jgi:hypothetical protein